MNGPKFAKRMMLLALLTLAELQAFAAPPSARNSPSAGFVVPAGFDLRLFAGEPMVVNPVAMTWDERGRLWVVELHQNPLAARKTRKDRIKILEDTDGDGKADKGTVFANGLRGATGILLGRGRAYLAEGPHLLALEDTNGDDKADKQTMISTGLRDPHALLNSLTWGPDAKLYMAYTLFGQPRERNTRAPVLAGGAARFDPRSSHFEVFAEGTGESWGLDFDGAGNALLTTAAGLFHILPGGIYGQPGSPPLVPAPPINDDAMSALLVANDARFMPASIQTGPDGAVWIADAYHPHRWQQNQHRPSPNRGGIWRAVSTGDDPKRAIPPRPSQHIDLGKLSSDELAALLAHSNVWHRRTAQRLLTERGLTAFGKPHLHQGTPLHKLFETNTNTEVRLAALWTMHGASFLEEVALDTAAKDKDPNIRAWAARLTGERGYLLKDSFDRLTKLAKDSELPVRTAAAIAARQFVSGDLTTDTPPKIPITEVATGGILSALFLNSSNNVDETFEFHFWMALEPVMAFDPNVVDYFHGDGARRQWPFSANVLRRITRLISQMNDPATLNRAIVELGKISPDAAPAVAAGLQGLLDGQQKRVLVPNREATETMSKLAQSDDRAVADAARRLIDSWQRIPGPTGSAVRQRATHAPAQPPGT